MSRRAELPDYPTWLETVLRVVGWVGLALSILAGVAIIAGVALFERATVAENRLLSILVGWPTGLSVLVGGSLASLWPLALADILRYLRRADERASK